MPYEVFDSKAVKFGALQLTIRSGKIGFSADAGDILSRRGAKYAHLLWDPEACKLAIRPAAREDFRTFRVSFPQGKRGGTLAAQSFLKYIGWHADGPVVVAVSWNEEQGILEASLPRANVGKGLTQEPQRRTKKGL
jgi:hypothetical protein